MELYCCSFASRNFIKTQEKQKKYILKCGFEEKNIFTSNTSILDETYLQRMPGVIDDLNNGANAGFTFKPYFLNLLLNRLKDGDILMYIDENDKPKKGIKEYMRYVFNKNPKLGIVVSGTNYPNIRYTSLFHRKNLSFEMIVSSNLFAQPEAGVLLIKNCQTSRSILRIWYELTFLNYLQTNNNNGPRDRYDQETLFILSRLYKSIKIESWLKYKLTGKGIRRFIDFESLKI